MFAVAQGQDQNPPSNHSHTPPRSLSKSIQTSANLNTIHFYCLPPFPPQPHGGDAGLSCHFPILVLPMYTDRNAHSRHQTGSTMMATWLLSSRKKTLLSFHISPSFPYLLKYVTQYKGSPHHCDYLVFSASAP